MSTRRWGSWGQCLSQTLYTKSFHINATPVATLSPAITCSLNYTVTSERFDHYKILFIYFQCGESEPVFSFQGGIMANNHLQIGLKSLESSLQYEAKSLFIVWSVALTAVNSSWSFTFPDILIFHIPYAGVANTWPYDGFSTIFVL